MWNFLLLRWKHKSTIYFHTISKIILSNMLQAFKDTVCHKWPSVKTWMNVYVHTLFKPSGDISEFRDSDIKAACLIRALVCPWNFPAALLLHCWQNTAESARLYPYNATKNTLWSLTPCRDAWVGVTTPLKRRVVDGSIRTSSTPVA